MYNIDTELIVKGAGIMAKRTIITIGRTFGSGGREIGKKLADELGIAFYDKELLEVAARESGISRQLFESNDEKPTSSLLYSLSVNPYSWVNMVGVNNIPSFSYTHLSHSRWHSWTCRRPTPGFFAGCQR